MYVTTRTNIVVHDDVKENAYSLTVSISGHAVSNNDRTESTDLGGNCIHFWVVSFSGH